MNVIFVEDEVSAVQNMLVILKEIDTGIHVLASLESIEDAVSWIENNPPPDLAFFDIRLSDGSSFEIFEKTEVKFPVVFTTAYNEYALKAFKVNSIDYLLKPIKKSDVEFAINKYKNLAGHYTRPDNEDFLNTLHAINDKLTPSYKQTLLIKKYDGFVPVPVDDFAFFSTKSGIVWGTTSGKEKYAVDEKLDLLEKQLSPDEFFRANRQTIVSRKSIVEVSNYFNGRLLVKTNPPEADQILISKARAGTFKKWLEK